MAGNDLSGMGPLETETMTVLWRAKQPLSVREVLERLNATRKTPLAYTTAMTVLVRLADKGALRREPAGRGFRYEPVAPDAAGVAVKGVLRDYGDAALAHFVEEAQTDPKLRRRLEALLKRDADQSG